MAQQYSLDLEFSSAQYASIADGSQTGLDITGDISFEAWIKLEQLPSAAGNRFFILSKDSQTSGERGYGVFIHNTGDYLQAYFADASNNFTEVRSTTSPFVAAGIWYHVAVTFDVSAGSSGVKMYVNGRDLATTAVTNNATSIDNNTFPFAIGFQPETTNYFDGLIKDVRVFNDIRTQTEIVADARTEDVSDANLVGEWNLNNAYTDSSGNGNTLTATASPVFSVDIPWEAPTGVESSAYILDLEAGSSQYASEADHSDFDFTGDFTAEMWVEMESLPSSGNEMTFVSKYNNDTNNRGWRVGYHNNAGTYRFRMVTSTNGTAFTEGHVNYTLATGNKYHLAFTKSGTTFTMYVDGVSVGTATVDSSIFASNSSLSVGCLLANSASQFVDGRMWDVRLFNDVRTQAEIITDARSTSVSNANLKGEWNFNNAYTDTSGGSHTLTASGSPTFRKWKNMLASALVGYWTLDSTPNDASGNARNGTTTGTVSYSTSIKKLGSASFDKTDASTANYISVADDADLDLAVADYAISFWVRFASITGEQGLVTKYKGATNGSWYTFKYPNSGGDANKISVALNNQTECKSTTTVAADTWYHIAYSQSGGTGYLYINGILDVTASMNTPTASTADMRFGGRGPDDANTMNGYLDEVYIASRHLTYGDVLDLYNAGTGITYTSPVVVATGDNFMMGANF